jgi:polyhydroxyalkanoate synthesis regulator phasin
MPPAIPHDIQSYLVPVGWIIIAMATAVVAILGLGWRGLLWLRSQAREVSDTSNKEALSSAEHKAFIAAIVSSAFTDHAETENRWRSGLQRELHELKARSDASYAEILRRADAQSESISSAHRRIDDLLRKA